MKKLKLESWVQAYIAVGLVLYFLGHFGISTVCGAVGKAMLGILLLLAMMAGIGFFVSLAVSRVRRPRRSVNGNRSER